ncbi:uncharacterized protein LOC6556917 [Drosophila grimshawi]|uniref:GH16725 n=1 Tax=Drosophila grimshawi TaxID=7222 RepID=B4J3C6_DROGR|nr:uncharacterized protein LOC6556917 [Drosophila grimshawi]EDV97225.1 GH16725 [Drosophila grimshawi]
MNTTSDINEFQYRLTNENTSAQIRPALSALQKELIEYATVSSRLLFIQDPCVFKDFHHSSEALNNYSTVELSAIVLNTILPNVHDYQLPEAVRKRLKLLKMNPCFRSTPQGYQYTPQCQENHFALQPTIDFSLSEQLPKLLSAQGPRPSSEFASHTMLLDQVVGPKFELSFEIASLLSALLSTDLELSSGGLHDREQIQKRLRRAKHNFESSGNMFPYRNNIESLTNNIVTFEKIKKKLCSTLVN